MPTAVNELPIARRAPARRVTPRERFDRNVVCVLGLPFDVIALDETVHRLREAALSRTRCFVSTPNLNFVIAARSDADFRGSVLRSDLSLADGAPLIWVARLLGLSLPGRVAGADVFEALRRHTGQSLGVFFFGGQAGAAEAACRNLNSTSGGLHCVGFDSAGFGSLEEMSDPKRIASINDSGADFVVVALGAKKGQAWIERNADTLDAPLLCHLGAVVNFVAGTVNRAPSWAQRIGFEWLWRIKEEPELWRRYRGDGIRFLGLMAAKVVPLALSTRFRGSRIEATIDSSIAVDGELRITLKGTFRRADLSRLRSLLSEAQTRGQCLRIDMSRVIEIDTALLGLLLLAAGSFGAEYLKIVGVHRRLRKQFRRHAASFLIGDWA